jgi:hypothetical protein
MPDPYFPILTPISLFLFPISSRICSTSKTIMTASKRLGATKAADYSLHHLQGVFFSLLNTSPGSPPVSGKNGRCVPPRRYFDSNASERPARTGLVFPFHAMLIQVLSNSFVKLEYVIKAKTPVMYYSHFVFTCVVCW